MDFTVNIDDMQYMYISAANQLLPVDNPAQSELTGYFFSLRLFLKSQAGAVVTRYPPTSEIGVRIPDPPQVSSW